MGLCKDHKIIPITVTRGRFVRRPDDPIARVRRRLWHRYVLQELNQNADQIDKRIAKAARIRLTEERRPFFVAKMGRGQNASFYGRFGIERAVEIAITRLGDENAGALYLTGIWPVLLGQKKFRTIQQLSALIDVLLRNIVFDHGYERIQLQNPDENHLGFLIPSAAYLDRWCPWAEVDFYALAYANGLRHLLGFWESRETPVDPHLLLQRLELAALLFVEAHFLRMYGNAATIAGAVCGLFSRGSLFPVFGEADAEIMEEAFVSRILDGGSCCHTMVATRSRTANRVWDRYMARRVIVPRGMRLENVQFLATATQIFSQPAPVLGRDPS
jgi:hypothetical protein